MFPLFKKLNPIIFVWFKFYLKQFRRVLINHIYRVVIISSGIINFFNGNYIREFKNTECALFYLLRRVSKIILNKCMFTKYLLNLYIRIYFIYKYIINIFIHSFPIYTPSLRIIYIFIYANIFLMVYAYFFRSCGYLKNLTITHKTFLLFNHNNVR